MSLERERMTSQERQPTRDELLAMAYVDGELDAASRAAFETRMREQRDLAREVAELQRLGVVARRMAPPEPQDAEWDRLRREPLQRAGRGLGFALVAAGLLGLVVFVGYVVARDDHLPLGLKLVIGAVSAGLLLLGLTVLRARLRTLPYDPYTEIRR